MARLAIPDDARAIAEVHVRSWRAAYRGVVADEFLDSLDVDRRVEMIEGVIRDESKGLLVAEQDGHVAGFSMLAASYDEGWGEVLAIYASPDYWGVGVGYELMAASVEWLQEQGYRRAMLMVLEDNPRARTFYERQGWSLGKRIRIENIGGRDLTEVRYEKDPLDAV
jgi:ribosomal protein S18 acetylase RimI-like enzyme